jgi:hypothetical protein
MALSKITVGNKSFVRDILSYIRYALGNWREVLGLAVFASLTGLAFNWSWLVAVGLAPILLGTLPCLLMCVFGACMMCRSGKEQPSAQATDNEAVSLADSGVSTLRRPSSCCRGSARDTSPVPEQSAKARG